MNNTFWAAIRSSIRHRKFQRSSAVESNPCLSKLEIQNAMTRPEKCDKLPPGLWQTGTICYPHIQTKMLQPRSFSCRTDFEVVGLADFDNSELVIAIAGVAHSRGCELRSWGCSGYTVQKTATIHSMLMWCSCLTGCLCNRRVVD